MALTIVGSLSVAILSSRTGHLDTTIQLITGQTVTAIDDLPVCSIYWTFSMKTYEFTETDALKDT
jgi:hypothetical protein